MNQTLRLGRIKGIPVGVNWSVLVIFALITWELAAIELPPYGPGSHASYWAAGLVAAVLFFASLLAHELSHAVVAKHNGIGVHSITLWLFGGVAQLQGEALTPGVDFRIAAVGPATSLVLAGAFGAIEAVAVSAGVHGLVLGIPAWLWRINLLLALFNVIPAAPLDGGRILRAGLWAWNHDHDRSSILAARAGRAFGYLLIALGAFLVFTPVGLWGLWPIGLGWFLVSAARAEERWAQECSDVATITVGEVMVRPAPSVLGGLTVSEMLAYTSPWYRTEVVPVTDPSGALTGLLSVERLAHVPAPAHGLTRVGDIAQPIATVPVSRPDAPMADLLQKMASAGGSPAVVLDASGQLVGVVTLADVDRAAQRAHRRAA
jgi:Zn-dependent protease